MHRSFALSVVSCVSRVSCLSCLACGCSVPEETASKDPVAALAPEAPIAAARTLRFSYDVSSEVSCSQSYEISSKYGAFTLTLTPPHDAKLSRKIVESVTFGAQPDMTKPPKSPTTYDRFRREDALEGVAGWSGDELRVALKTESSSVTLTCKAAKVQVVSYEGGARHEVSADVLRCTPSMSVPDELHEETWGGGLVFGDGDGIEAVFETRGMFGDFVVGPELHFSP